jgi:hypothetical protein
MTIYFVNSPRGKSGGGIIRYNYASAGAVLLEDLDRTRRPWQPVNYGENDELTGGDYVTFQNVTATRFKITQPYSYVTEPPIIFEEVILGEPDKD